MSRSPSSGMRRNAPGTRRPGSSGAIRATHTRTRARTVTARARPTRPRWRGGPSGPGTAPIDGLLPTVRCRWRQSHQHVAPERLGEQHGRASDRGERRPAAAAPGAATATRTTPWIAATTLRQWRGGSGAAQPGQQPAGDDERVARQRRWRAPTRPSDRATWTLRTRIRKASTSMSKRAPERRDRPGASRHRAVDRVERAAPRWPGRRGRRPRSARVNESAISAATPPTSEARTRVTRLAGPSGRRLERARPRRQEQVERHRRRRARPPSPTAPRPTVAARTASSSGLGDEPGHRTAVNRYALGLRV